ncbi:flagellar basal-body MS-ring/collar protein FliF [Schwartzia succinivorans]|jgi:flagellar M-ring protein FliF|uniref:Flagellar M-ring protein n=1 Tax=Schwartzia succinivorans DSM 10502 TaxID=1123243 RepID=A0A1M4TCQ5_9FIRM|nr:flagellar basal-body MS-ring/collar protein FliF [Schwartzia succinivorans]MBQ1469532.1 flagellar M-ring protein FliF [Schwartzia sp. (in: firmicutes)]MBQ1918661.1 flagellar M-ring protein FliF [Schwartzia sp. (in: firmicutes)]MBQ4152442.1 flagellar M-ring protein FliF [Schwartzia sp. (in: firmicutes)]MCR5447584.1 flagellar M-ring protein FliF [Schwartzia sp. (in: firmicutes)]SHE42174.1 flagellar M-ring protein FliF [Schwartzia succinivorans DSM 10502]
MAEWKERYLQLWNKTTKRQRYMILGGVVLLFALILGSSYFYGSKPDLVPLFTNMEAKDAGEVAAKLKESKIQYEVQETKQGVTILVPSKDVHGARLDLATQGLPRGNKGFEIFDDSKLGVTEFQNKVNYLQALQGELTRTIEQIAAVDKVRVHIVLPEDSLYKKNEKPATASIMLKLRPDKKLSKKEIKGIVNLTAHSIQGLTPENITIVDDTGKILNDPDEDDEKNVSNQTISQLEMTRKVKERMQKDVQSLLDQALGEGRAFVRVNVELDFDQRQTDRQIFTPVVDESGIIRSQQDMSESYNGTSNNPGGPAGVQSNIPGYVAQAETANAQYEKKESTKNYEINEEKSKIIASPGSIRRVNIAVLVNDDITRAQQDSILRSVSSAVGINAERGDTVSVEPLPFSTELADRRAAEEAAERARQDRNFYMSVAAGVLLLALIIGAVLLRRRRLRLEREAYEEEQRQLALAEQERLEEERRMEQERAELIAAGQVPEQLVDEEPQLTEDELRTLSEREAIEKLINEKPAEVAMLVKTWLSED